MTIAQPPRFDDVERDLSAPHPFRIPVRGVLEHRVIETPLGRVLLTSDGHSLNGLHLGDFDAILARCESTVGVDSQEVPKSPLFAEVESQLDEYLVGERRSFEVPLAPIGTEFQKQVWTALTVIPFGETASYGELAGWLHRPLAARAVGAANGRNPISIIVPCHRVIGANGSLTGYAWGEDMKRSLLELETGRGSISRNEFAS